MMDAMQSAAVATSSLPLAPSQGAPLVAAKDPLSMSIKTSRFARAIPAVVAVKDPLSMSMETSRFAGGIPKASTPAASKAAAAPKPSWSRELDLSGNTTTSPPEKKGGVRHNKRRTSRGQAPVKASRHWNHPTYTALPPAAPSAVAAPTVVAAPTAIAAPTVVAAPVTPSESPIKAVSLRPTAPTFVPRAAAAAAAAAVDVVTTPPLTMSEPSSPTTSTDPSEPHTPTSNSREDSKVKKEHIIYLQRRFKDGLKQDQIARQTAAEFPELCKGCVMGAKLQPRKRGWKLWETQSSCTRDGMPSGTFELEEKLGKNENCL